MRTLLVLLALMMSVSIAFSQAKPLPFEQYLWKGRVTPFYGSSTDPKLQNLLRLVRNAELAERMAAVAQNHMRLRYNLGIGFTECGRANAFYQPSTRTIMICLEFLDQVTNLMIQKKETFTKATPAQLDAWINGILWFVFLHELAHAVIDTNQVPITGREEDVADQFAAWYALNFIEPRGQPIFAPATWFFRELSSSTRLQEVPPDTLKHLLADEHSLQEQRVFNFACWRFGHNPAAGVSLARMVNLPEERAQRCQAEYAKLDDGIRSRFKKYLRGPH